MIENAKSPAQAERLKAVVLKHFKTNKQLADILGIKSTDLSKYVTGRAQITRRFAYDLQGKAGISGDYILYGKEPMMLDIDAAPIQPKYDAPISLSPKTSATKHGSVKHYIIDGDKRRPRFRDGGVINVVDILLGDDDTPKPVLFKFSNLDYCSMYGLKVGSWLVVDGNANVLDGDVVLVQDGIYFYLCDVQEGVPIDKVVGKSIKGDILGVVLTKIEDM
jgi:hypothetical protein